MDEKEIKLITLAQKGDMRAFEQLICRYDRHVLNIAYRFRYDKDDSKDIYQEVFLRVFKGIKSFQFNSEFSTWLYRIATNVCLTYKSRQSRNQHTSLDQGLGSEEESFTIADSLEAEDKTDSFTEKNELRGHIQNALEKLPSQQKLAFTLKHYDEFKIKEIADMMNCAEGTIKRYIFNATVKLREHLTNVYMR